MAKARGKGARESEERPPVASGPPAWERWGWAVATAAVLVLLMAFFNPIFFGGQTFQPPDNIASVAHRPYIQESLDGPGSWFERYPLWTPYVFSGMPSLGSMIAAPYTNPLSLAIFFVSGPFRIVTYYLFLGVLAWVFLRRLGLSTWTGLLGASAFLFMPHVITLIMFGHNSKVCTLVLLPAVILLTHLVWIRPGLRHAALLALAIGVMLLTHHVQIAYYTLLAAGLYLLVGTVAGLRGRAAPRALLRPWGFWLGALVLGGAMSAVILLPVEEYAAHSIRGGTEGGLSYAYATNWSFHPLEVTTFFLPSFVGYGQNSYWGWMPFTDFPHYMGILVLLLAVVTLVLWPRERMHIYLALLGVLALLLSFGRHLPLFYDAMFKFFPYFNKFRVPSMILFLTQFSVAMLAALGLARLQGALSSLERQRAARVVMVAGGASLAVVVVLAGLVMSGSLDGTIRQRLATRFAAGGVSQEIMSRLVDREAARAVSLATGDAAAVGLVLILGVGLLVLGLRRRVPPLVLVLGILALTLFDLWRIDARPAQYSPRREEMKEFEPTSAVRYLQEDSTLYRVLPLTGGGANNNWLAYFKISSIMGYHPAKLRIYQDLLDERGPVGISKSLRAGNFNVVNMLNMKYVISPQDLPIGPLVAVHRGEGEVVMENTEALPRLWFVDSVEVISEERAHLEALADPAWNPARTALCFEDPGPVEPGTGGTAEITHYQPRGFEARVTSPGNCLLVVSEVYYEPGWKAWVDGVEVPIHRTDYVLRAVRVPPGEHTLRLWFDDPAYRAGATVTMASFGAILLLLGISFVPRRKAAAPAQVER